MIDGAFEDYCWRDVVSEETLRIYSRYKRDLFVGPNPALLVVDLYELVYQGGPRPVAEVAEQYPSSCGIHAYEAIQPTQRLLGAARAAAIPILYSTSETRADAKPARLSTTKGRSGPKDPRLFEIRPEFRPEPGDVVIAKQRASAFFGTSLATHLVHLGVRSLIVIGESTSGCVRATVVDAQSHGYHIALVEECCFDRSPLSHKVNLFDMHHKYADVMHLEDVLKQLQTAASTKTVA